MFKNSMKTKGVLSTTLIILFFVLGLILIIGVILGIPYIINNIGDRTKILNAIGGFIIGITYFIMVALLSDIVSSSRVNIFVKSNVYKFRKIGYLLLINLVIHYAFGTIYGVGGMRFVDLAPGVFITPGMCVYFISGLLCFVIADAFDQAITIKEENEFTV